MNATVTALYPAATQAPGLIVFGINHKTAPLELRERLHVDRNATLALCKRLVATNLLEEALVLSTCNRVEIYGTRPSPETAGELLCDFLAREHRLAHDLLKSHSYHFHGLSAVHHGFRVASSLDSLVVGEPQITG
jgi:glutamyl-tRNA reductase